MADQTVTHYRLPDGSRVQVESDGRQAMITRWVDQSEYGGLCVWGQVFSFPPDTHAAQVDKVLKSGRRRAMADAEWWPEVPWPPPADPFDEDGYCDFCGNGSWKFHAPWCGWADLRDWLTGVCGVSEGRCSCVLAPHSAGPHVCKCEGSWEEVDGEFVIRAVPRINEETGEQNTWWDPDPAVALANARAERAEQYMLSGADPLTARILAGPPIRVDRGPIRYITPPSLDGTERP